MALTIDLLMLRVYSVRMFSNSMPKSFVLLGFLATTLVAGCSSSPTGPAKIGICRSSHNPVSMDAADGSRKIEVKPGDADLDLPVGNFEFSEAQYYYRDFDRNIVLHFNVKPGQESAKPEITITCIGGNGLSRDSDKVSGQIEFVSEMNVVSASKVLITTRSFSFELGPGADPSKMLVLADGSLNQTESKLSDLYNDAAPIVEHALYQKDSNSLESRLKLEEVTEDKGKKAGVLKWVQVSYSLTATNP